MPDFERGDLIVGGNHGYYAQHRPYRPYPTGVPLVQHVEVLDDTGNRLRVNGGVFSPAGDLYLALGDPAGLADHDPHDIAYAAGNPPKLAVIVARADNTAELRTYSLDGALLAEWPVATDPGWTRDRYLKLDVNCAGIIAYYTGRGRTIFRFDLSTGTQLDPFAQLASDSPYVYADFQLLPPQDGGLVVAETGSGMGPRNAVALDLDGTSLWTDEINPIDGRYEVYRRALGDGSDILSFPGTLDPGGANDAITALIVYDSPAAPEPLAIPLHTAELGTALSRPGELELGTGSHTRQGISSQSYYPPDGGPSIDSAWANEVASLLPYPGMTVRCELVLKDVADADLPAELAKYKTAFDLYAAAQCNVIALLSEQLYQDPINPDTTVLASPLDSLVTPYRTNPYIRGFATRAQAVASYLSANTAVTEYIIGNEPNNQDPVAADRFASLMTHCWNAMTSAPLIYWGGIFLPLEDPPSPAPYPVVASYLSGTSASIYDWIDANVPM